MAASLGFLQKREERGSNSDQVLVLSKIPGLSDPDFLICKNEATGLCLLKDLPVESLGLEGQATQIETYTALRER